MLSRFLDIVSKKAKDNADDNSSSNWGDLPILLSPKQSKERIAHESVMRYVSQLRKIELLVEDAPLLSSAVNELLFALERRNAIESRDIVGEIECAIHDVLNEHEQKFTFAYQQITEGRIIGDKVEESMLCDLCEFSSIRINSIVDWYVESERAQDQSKYDLIRELNLIEYKISILEAKNDSFNRRLSIVEDGELSFDEQLSLLVDLGIEAGHDEKLTSELKEKRDTLMRKIRRCDL